MVSLVAALAYIYHHLSALSKLKLILAAGRWLRSKHPVHTFRIISIVPPWRWSPFKKRSNMFLPRPNSDICVVGVTLFLSNGSVQYLPAKYLCSLFLSLRTYALRIAQIGDIVFLMNTFCYLLLVAWTSVRCARSYTIWLSWYENNCDKIIIIPTYKSI